MAQFRHLSFLAFFLVWAFAFPASQAGAAATCASQGGTCEEICEASQYTPSSDCSGDKGECCLGSGGPVVQTTSTAELASEGKVCKQTGGSDQGTCQGACELSSSYYVPSADCTEDGASECCVPIEYEKTTPGGGGGSSTDPNVAGACGGGRCQAGEEKCDKGETPKGACNASRGGGICCVKDKSSTGTGGQQATINFTNPLEFDTVEEVLTSLLSTLQGIIVTLALVFLVIGAILYIISAGDEGRMETGKKAITAAMIGLAIGLAAPSFLKEIGEVLGWGETNSALVDSAPTLTSIALKVLHFLLSIVGILAIIMLVIGGLTYLTAAGDEDRIETGKKIVTYSIVGIIIAFGALVIVTQIGNFFV